MTVTEQIFKSQDIEGTSNQLAEHMPQGKVWEGKRVSGSNLRGLVNGMARPFNLSQQKIEELAREFDINQTVLLIDEWEKSVGLPDNCIGQISNINERRSRVIERLKKKPIVKIEDMQQLVDNFFPNIGIKLYPGSEYYAFEYDFEATFLGNVDEKFIIVAEVPSQSPQFEYEFEFEFVAGIDQSLLRCLLERIIPSNVLLEIEEVA